MTSPVLPPYRRLSPPDTCECWAIPMQIVTPLYGGGASTRQVDEQTPVRASSIRGQLRFWWRALYGGVYRDAKGLYQRERELFGGLGKDPKDMARSQVNLAVHDIRRTAIDNSDVAFSDKAGYALWAARATTQGDRQPPAERWAAGLTFTLVARLMEGRDAARDRLEVERTLRTWLLFGGIGGRTRRGCGALGIADATARDQWLPESLDPGKVRAWLSPEKSASQGFPSLDGARLCIGRSQAAAGAWYDAIGWLRDFRQGTHPSRTDITDRGAFARQRPSLATGNAGRPGRSRWPEPDLIRHTFSAFDHTALIPKDPKSWPRTQFGLPIQFRFQNKDRTGNFLANRPPKPGALGWEEGGKLHQRLSSPLIVKPAQDRKGQFVGVALWLSRTLPPSSIVGVQEGKHLRNPALITQMPLDPLFSPLEGKASTQDAFMDWLETAHHLTGGRL